MKPAAKNYPDSSSLFPSLKTMDASPCVRHTRDTPASFIPHLQHHLSTVHVDNLPLHPRLNLDRSFFFNRHSSPLYIYVTFASNSSFIDTSPETFRNLQCLQSVIGG